MRSLLVGGAILALVGCAWADVSVEDVLARRQGSSVNLRVTVNNPAGTTQKGPVKVVLFVRQTNSDPWQTVKTWTNIQKLGAGERVSRDYFDENNATLKALAESGAFEVRATAQGPGAPKVGERVYSWKDTMKGK